MNKVISTERIPIKIWAGYVEEGAMEQAKNLANLPFAHKHISLMPDCHQGYGMPIGGVMATRDVVVPNAVGVDIGCGMASAKTDIPLDEVDSDKLKKAMSLIRERVPVGFNHHSEKQEHDFFNGFCPDIKPLRDNIQSAQYQIGTLGGGNHFMEIQTDGEVLWLMIHSGSRNFGYKIAKYYHEVAKELCESWYSDIPTPDLSFLPVDSDEGADYMVCMDYALFFAKASRKRMMWEMMDSLAEVFPVCGFDEIKDVHHNYARWENHFGKNYIIHRKGATSARDGEFGIIPGSQGTSSYIVKGKGNKDSFTSCSHGAGRCMSRTKARKTLSLDGERDRMDEKGIIHSIRNEKDLDEAASAYKDIDVVMENQKDLVDVVVELTPLAVIKG